MAHLLKEHEIQFEMYSGDKLNTDKIQFMPATDHIAPPPQKAPVRKPKGILIFALLVLLAGAVIPVANYVTPAAPTVPKTQAQMAAEYSEAFRQAKADGQRWARIDAYAKWMTSPEGIKARKASAQEASAAAAKSRHESLKAVGHVLLIPVELAAGLFESLGDITPMGWLIIVAILGFSGIISAINRVNASNAKNAQEILEKMEEQRQAEIDKRQAEIDDNPKFTPEMWQSITRAIAEDEARLAELTAAGVTSGQEFTALSECAKARKEANKITEREFKNSLKDVK